MADMSMYQQLAADLGFAESKMIPELFAYIADEDEAKVMLAASPPATVDEISEITNRYFEEQTCHFMDYELGDRCPTFFLKPKK